MSFQNPGMFWWLFALAIPIIVHLFNFRKHKVLLFSNIELLKNLQQQTRKAKTLKHYIVLLLRLLAIASLIFAFAQPYSRSDLNLSLKNENLISVYIDNSMSMQSRGTEMTLLDEAKQNAISLTKSFSLNNKYILFTNDFLPRHQRLMSASEFIQEVEQVRSEAPSALLENVLLRNKNIQEVASFDDRMLFAFSDFQKSMLNLDNLPADSNLNLFLVQGKSTIANNLYIDSCWFETPVLQASVNAEIVVRVVNGGKEPAVGIPLQLTIDGEQKAVANVDVPVNESVETKLQFITPLAGFHDSKLSILDYPVVFDDDLYFTFEIQSKIKVLEIYEKEASPWLKLLFGEDEFVAFNSMQRQNLDFQSLNDYNVIIINEIDEIHSGLQLQLSAFTDQGGSLVLLPSQKNTQAYATIASNYGFNYDLSQDTAKTRVFSVDESDKLFKDVFVKIPENADFPTVFKHFPMHLQNASSAKILIQLLNGNPFLISNVAGNGKVYAFSSPIQLTWTDFQRNSLFVPVWYRILLMSIRNAPLYYNLGEEVIIATPYHQTTGEKILKFRSLSSDFEIIPEHRNRNNSAEVIIHDVIPTAGQFALFSSDSLTLMLSFNFNRKESILTYFQADELLNSAILSKYKTVKVLENNGLEMQSVLKDFFEGSQWYKYFIWLALLFILIEVMILRFWK